MSCLIKHIPPNIKVASGNRGLSFPYNTFDLPEEDICFLAFNNNGNTLEVRQENEDLIILKCIE